MGRMELCSLLDCRLIQHREFTPLTHINYSTNLMLATEYLDDFINNDCRWSLLVAILALVCSPSSSTWHRPLGLTVRFSVWIGYTIAGIFVCMTGRIGASYHIGFPVVARASFGVWGSLWPVFNRAAMACIWYGVQAWLGGKFKTS